MLELILGIFIGFIAGLIVAALMSVKTINDFIEQDTYLIKEQERLVNENNELTEVRMQTETRMSNLTKLVRDIIKTIKKAEITQEFAVETLRQIKKLVYDYQSKN